ncbi:TnsA-like heteromeric transposase endonuclease subunit [Couchioplanes caeruleus]|uniref:TnsA-like heteromeric transposase endonuclease subunit n=1 Tax=Couchioplanes caeruleus TaxID=56438 RepID=UPI000A020B59|nr:TnsA-like heteromeric transposase endonuclease subunit [Couchioplanes caeruleus]
MRLRRDPLGRAASGGEVTWAPDYFARLVDGRGLVVDCRPADRIKPRDAAAFAATHTACELVGWEYRLVDAPEPVLVRNVRWLAGYRHPRYRMPQTVTALREVFAEPAPLETPLWLGTAVQWAARRSVSVAMRRLSGARGRLGRGRGRR